MRPTIKLPSRQVDIFESFDGLRHLLLESVGSYCAYCELPITVDFPVATKISVSDINHPFNIHGNIFSYTIGVQPRRFARAWVNQQAICSACANAKATEPGSQEGFTQLYATNIQKFNQLMANGAPNRLRLSDDEADDVFIAATQIWVWPDESTDEMGVTVLPGDHTFDLFTYEASSRTQLDLANNNLVRLTNDERLETWANQAQQGVWVIPNAAYIQNQPNSQTLASRVQNTILGLNLNYSNTSLPTFADRRVLNRTTTLATINTAINHLSMVVTQIKNAQGQQQRDQDDIDQDLLDPKLNILLGFIRETLRATGFWTLWAQRLLATINDLNNGTWNIYSASARKELLYQLLIEYEIDLRDFAIPTRTSEYDPIPNDSEIEEIGSQLVIPGTDVNRLTFLQ